MSLTKGRRAKPVLVALGVSLLMASCTEPRRDHRSEPDPRGPSEDAVLPRFQRMACSLPQRILRRLWHGYHPERSGDVSVIATEQNTFGYAHSGPQDFLQNIPLFFYGPGQVPRAGAVSRRGTIPDISETIAPYLGYEFDAPDGRLLPEALPRQGHRPPRLVMVVVLDGAGLNVLRSWPDDWPTVRSLIPEGVWYERATVGTSPSVTPPVHATLGTGAYPRRHGLVSLEVRIDGEIRPSYGDGPEYLLSPSLADLYDRSTDNAAEVGVVAFRDWHLGMVGRGSFMDGGDRDLAALLDHQTGAWTLEEPNSRYFAFPSYINDVPGLQEAIRELDAEDGKLDGRWLDDTLEDRQSTWRRSPAFVRWQTAVLDEVIRREGFGADDVPDLLFTNYKQIDEVGHRWSMHSPQMQQVVRASDQALADLIDILNRRVGRGRWMMVVTADHGTVPNPSTSGAVFIDREEFQEDIEEEFGEGVLQRWRPTQLWLDRPLLKRNGHSFAEVADFVIGYTMGDNAPSPDGLPPQARDTSLFRASFPSRALLDLPCLPPGPSG